MSRQRAGRAGRLLIALALAVGWQLTPPAAQPAVAACSTGSCATLEIVFSPGAGTGYVSSFPAGIDCYWNGSGREGVDCIHQFDVGSGIDVQLFLDPGAHSYACYGGFCGGLEARVTYPDMPKIHLNPGDDKDVFPVFNIANKTHYEFSFSGDGAGRVTASMGGIDCRWSGTARSGTCGFDFYWVSPPTTLLTVTDDPDDDSITCSVVGVCYPPGEAHTYGTNLSTSNRTISTPFFLAHPIVVQVNGSGTVVSDPVGISCPATCSVWFAPNKTVKLTAKPASGWYVVDWSGKCDATTGNTCSFVTNFQGATTAVTFARSATPPPSAAPTPRPTTNAQPPTPIPSHAAPPTVRPSPPLTAGGSTSAPGPSGKPAPGASAQASALPGNPSAGVPGQAAVPSPAASPGLAIAHDAESSISPFVLLLLVVIAVLIGVIGFLAGDRRRRATPPRA